MDIPAELRPVIPYLRRAKEVERIQPVVSYFCRYYAVQAGLKLEDLPQEATEYLVHQLGELERIKEETDIPENEEESKQLVKAFALRIFDKADRADRDGNADAGTAQKYYAASHFLEVLMAFGELDEDEARILKYAKYKCAYINKCLREGVEPQSGPVDNQKSAQDKAREEEDLMQQLAALGANTDAPSSASSSTTSASSTTPARAEDQPGFVDPFADDDDDEEQQQEQNPQTNMTGNTQASNQADDDDDDDEAELLNLMQGMSGGAPKPSAPSAPKANHVSAKPVTPSTTTSTSTSSSINTAKKTAGKTAKKAVEVHEVSPEQQRMAQMLLDIDASKLALTTDKDKMRQAQRLSKFVTSSLQFYDAKSAVTNLVGALALLLQEEDDETE